MILRSLLAAGALALRASAFLVPLEVVKEAVKEVEAAKSQLETIWTAQDSVIHLNCPGCAFFGPQEEGIEYSTNDENTLEVKIAISDASTLLVNSVPIFSLTSQPVPTTLTASQIRTSDSLASSPQPVGYALEIFPPTLFHDVKLTKLQLTILELAGHPVHVDVLSIFLLSTDSSLAIAKTETIPFASTPGAEQCETSVCRFRAIVASRIASLIEAAKHYSNKFAQLAKIKGGCHGKGKFGGKGGHHPRPHGGPHHGHHMMHRLAHILRQTLRFFIIPALLGVVGGLMASALGMLVGQVIVYFWIRSRRNAGNHESMAQSSEEVVIVDGEKDALMTAEDDEVPPPGYHDVVEIVITEPEEKA